MPMFTYQNRSFLEKAGRPMILAQVKILDLDHTYPET